MKDPNEILRMRIKFLSQQIIVLMISGVIGIGILTYSAFVRTSYWALIGCSEILLTFVICHIRERIFNNKIKS